MDARVQQVRASCIAAQPKGQDGKSASGCAGQPFEITVEVRLVELDELATFERIVAGLDLHAQRLPP